MSAIDRLLEIQPRQDLDDFRGVLVLDQFAVRAESDGHGRVAQVAGDGGFDPGGDGSPARQRADGDRGDAERHILDFNISDDRGTGVGDQEQIGDRRAVGALHVFQAGEAGAAVVPQVDRLLEGDFGLRGTCDGLARVEDAPRMGLRGCPGESAIGGAGAMQLQGIAQRRGAGFLHADIACRQAGRRTVGGGQGAFITQELQDIRALDQGHGVIRAVLDPIGHIAEPGGPVAALLIVQRAGKDAGVVDLGIVAVVEHQRVVGEDRACRAGDLEAFLRIGPRVVVMQFVDPDLGVGVGIDHLDGNRVGFSAVVVGRDEGNRVGLAGLAGFRREGERADAAGGNQGGGRRVARDRQLDGVAVGGVVGPHGELQFQADEGGLVRQVHQHRRLVGQEGMSVDLSPGRGARGVGGGLVVVGEGPGAVRPARAGDGVVGRGQLVADLVDQGGLRGEQRQDLRLVVVEAQTAAGGDLRRRKGKIQHRTAAEDHDAAAGREEARAEHMAADVGVGVRQPQPGHVDGIGGGVHQFDEFVIEHVGGAVLVRVHVDAGGVPGIGEELVDDQPLVLRESPGPGQAGHDQENPAAKAVEAVAHSRNVRVAGKPVAPRTGTSITRQTYSLAGPEANLHAQENHGAGVCPGGNWYPGRGSNARPAV